MPDPASRRSRLAVGIARGTVAPGLEVEARNPSTLSAISFAYPDVPGDVRAGLAARLAGRGATGGAFVLSTCLRVEVAVAGGQEHLDQVLVELLGRVPHEGVRREGSDAALHLFRVAAGLDSPVVGEVEVWTQFRRALAAAKEAGLPGRLCKLLERAVASGRAARSLLPASPRGSLAAVAAGMVAEAPRVAVLGGGEMSSAAVSCLLELPAAPEVVVVARTPGKVTAEVEVWGFDRALEAIATFPAVISATSAKRRLVADEDLARVLAGRADPLVLVDLAMPPDFAPPPDAPVRYLAIDGLAALVADGIDTREAEEVVDAATREAWRAFDARHTPLIADLYSTADEVVERTVERFAGRLRDPEDVRVLRQTAHTVARTLLAGPVGRIKERSHSAPEVAELLAEAFSLEQRPLGRHE